MECVALKFQRARIAIAFVILSLAVLATTLLTLCASIQGSANTLTHTVRRAEAEFSVQLGHVNKEERARREVDRLLSSQLDSLFEDTYPKCLARGISEANNRLIDTHFTEYADVRDEVIDWVKINCDRIFFTPQAKPSHREFHHLHGWARLQYETARIYYSIRIRFGKAMRWFTEKKAGNKMTVQEMGTLRHTHVGLPNNFRIVGCDLGRCKLVYTSPEEYAHISDTNTTDTLEASRKKLAGLLTMRSHLHLAFRVLYQLYFMPLLLEALFTIGLLVVTIYSSMHNSGSHNSQAITWRAMLEKLTPLDIHLLCGLFVQYLYLKVLVCIQLDPGCLQDYAYSMGLAISAISLSAFMVPHATCFPNILYLIVGLRELISLANDISSSPTLTGNEHMAQNLISDNQQSQTIAEPTICAHGGPHIYRRISATTTLQQDLDVMRESLLDIPKWSAAINTSTEKCRIKEEGLDGATVLSDPDTGSEWSVIEDA